jgi:large subunit ribosomal protein LP0
MSGAASDRKKKYLARVTALFTKYDAIMLVTVDNVGSKQLQTVRRVLRERGDQLILGKNTLIRKALKRFLANDNKPDMELLVPELHGNIGLIFTRDPDLKGLKDMIEEAKIPAAAKAGAIAPVSVVIPAGLTDLEPTQTSFLQALNIATKITKGKIEILNPVNLFNAGDRVGSSAAALLQKMDITPFNYGLICRTVYDHGSLYQSAVLNLTENDLVAKAKTAIASVAAVGLAIGVPNLASLPHSINAGYKNIVAIYAANDDLTPTRNDIKKLKEFIANPSAFAAAAPAAAAATPAAAAAAATAAPAAAAAAPAKEESEDEGFGGLFD